MKQKTIICNYLTIDQSIFVFILGRVEKNQLRVEIGENVVGFRYYYINEFSA